MAFPTWVENGALATGTGAITPVSGANTAVDDILICIVQTENAAVSMSTPNGFVEIGSQANKAAGTLDTNPACRIFVAWKRATSAGSQNGPTIADSGDHNVGMVITFRGTKTTGDPWNVIAEGNDSGANDTTGVIPGGTTTVAECLIVLICGTSFNGTSTAQFSGFTNADLANINERQDNSHTVGLGGGFGTTTGEKASSGLFGNTTVTLANTSFKGAQMIALEPAPAPTPPEITFIPQPSTRLLLIGVGR